MEFITNINVIFYILGYLIGGIPFGYLVARKLAGVNITKEGSGSIGATNVYRVLSQQSSSTALHAKKAAVATIALDALKGAVVIIVAKLLGVEAATQWAVAFLAVVGHCFSPYLKFEGGKGVATSFGVIAVMLPLEALLGLITWFVAGKKLKISSLSSLLGVVVAVGSSYVIHPEIPEISSHAPIFLIGFIIFYKHIPNILNLIQGKEKPVL